jgi:hypothetical protein
VLTYRHNLITPGLSNLWPSLRLTSQREGLVEQYRTSRVTGLTGGIAYASTWTFTPTHTNTPTDTPTPSQTYTSTATSTPSNTPTKTSTSTITPPAVYCTGRGTVLRQKFSNISGTSIGDLTNHANYPESPDLTDFLPLFEIEVHTSKSTPNPDYFGTRMRAYLCPPFTGDYNLYISSDDNGELWLGTNANPSSASRIARVTGWTNTRIWSKIGEYYQKSAPQHLTAGTLYYIEALMKEGSGGDNLAIGWTLPGWIASPVVIEGQYLVPFEPEAVVPTATATPSRTPRPSRTPTNTATSTNTMTSREKRDATRAAGSLTAEYRSPTPTNTPQPPTSTNTSLPPTNTKTSAPPTSTNTSAPPTDTPLPSDTPQPSNTPTASKTPTRTATCAIPIDLGGCR